MNGATIFQYVTADRLITFSINSAFWVTSINGASSNSIDVSESQGYGQIGSSITNQSVKSKNLTINGEIMSDIEVNRKRLLACVAPGVAARFIVTQNNESWYLECVPTKTPTLTDGEGIQSFQFTVKCAYPYWRSTNESVISIIGLIPLFRFPFNTGGTWVLSRLDSAGYRPVVNTGNTPMDFEVVFYARSNVLVPGITDINRQSFIKLKAGQTLAAGESIKVSTIYGQKGAILTRANNTAENGFRFLSYDSDLNMKLYPGENLFRATAEDNLAGLEVKVGPVGGVLSGV